MGAITAALEGATAEQIAEMFRATFDDDTAAARMVRAALVSAYEDLMGEDAADALLDEFCTSRGL